MEKKQKFIKKKEKTEYAPRLEPENACIPTLSHRNEFHLQLSFIVIRYVQTGEISRDNHGNARLP